MNHAVAQTWTGLIIAAAAVATLLLQYWGSQQTVETLAAANKFFEAGVQPVVKLAVVIPSKSFDGSPSCERPITGIAVGVRNFSRVPVVAKTPTIEWFHGLRPIDTDPVSKRGGEERILAPNELDLAQISHSSISEVYAKLRGNNPHPLKVKLSLRFRLHADPGPEVWHCYETTATVGLRCDDPSVGPMIYTEDEKLNVCE